MLHDLDGFAIVIEPAEADAVTERMPSQICLKAPAVAQVAQVLLAASASAGVPTR